MNSVVLFVSFLALTRANAVEEQCGVNPDGSSTCSGDDQATFIQSRVQAHTFEDGEVHKYGPLAAPTHFMEYFKTWAQGSIESRLGRIAAADGLSDEEIDELPVLQSAVDGDGDEGVAAIEADEADTEEMSAGLAVETIKSAMMDECHDKVASIEESDFVVLYAEPADEQGIRHALLKRKNGKLQYIAVHRLQNGRHHALHADPPLCAHNEELLETGNWPRPNTLSATDPVDPDESKDKRKTGGERHRLGMDDPLVQDCKRLFARTVDENCQKAVDIKPLAATRRIVDGLSVHMKTQVCKAGTDQCALHHPECDFQTDTDQTDAKLMQLSNGTLPEEKLGLKATLRLTVPICQVEVKQGVSMSEAEEDAWLLQYSMGDNSEEVGNEHVYDDYPSMGALEVESVPTELDFRKKYAACFPALSGKGPGTETIRNQGTCGSCWAFASATSSMINLCTIIHCIK